MTHRPDSQLDVPPTRSVRALQRFRSIFRSVAKRPALVLVLGCMGILMGGAALWVFGSEAMASINCTGRIEGKLSPSYQEVVTKRNGVVRSREYQLEYTYTVDGQTYSGEDTVRDEPSSLDVTVLYNPEAPAKSELTRHYNLMELLMGLGFCGFGIYVGLFAPIPRPAD